MLVLETKPQPDLRALREPQSDNWERKAEKAAQNKTSII